MKKINSVLVFIIILAALVLMMSISVSAEDTFYRGTWGNLTWELNATTGELVISGEGGMNNFSSNSASAWRGYKNSIKSVTIGEGVTSIGEYAFYKCSSLTSITIPDSITSIGSDAFYGCTGLTNITIPSSVTSIGSSAFTSCHKLIEVYNRSRLVITAGSSNYGSVAYYAKNVYTATSGTSKLFVDNDFLFYVDDASRYLMGYTGNDTTITLPASYNGESYHLYKYAFSHYTDLTSITIPKELATISDYAFEGCTGLTNVSFDNNSELTTIGSSAFFGCTSLASITFSEGSKLGTINSNAFAGCMSLANINIPSSVSSIDSSAFEDCRSLTSFTIPYGITSIAYGHLFGLFEACTHHDPAKRDFHW